MLDRPVVHRIARFRAQVGIGSRALVTCLVLGASLLGAASGQALTLSFDKAAASDTVWIGTVEGDVVGTLTTVLIAADTSNPVWSVDFYWIVTASDPSYSFVARLSGTLDSETGAVAMHGRVVEGYRAGAVVDETGLLYDADRSAFRGTISLHGS